MIVECNDNDFRTINTIINQAAQAYRSVIPADRWHEPYMPMDELRHEIADGVSFLGFRDAHGAMDGVMGAQDVGDVCLIRHAYVRPAGQRRGIGGELLAAIRARTAKPILIGTWAAATWAIGFYEKHGFSLTTPAETARLLQTYWSIPERQIETSVVLGDDRWFSRTGKR